MLLLLLFRCLRIHSLKARSTSWHLSKFLQLSLSRLMCSKKSVFPIFYGIQEKRLKNGDSEISCWITLWVVPENFHTHTMGSILEFQRDGGAPYLDWISKGMRGGGGHWTGIPKDRGFSHLNLHGNYRFVNRTRTVIIHLITQEKGKQSTRGPEVNQLHVRFII